jgi:hypothetical protein
MLFRVDYYTGKFTTFTALNFLGHTRWYLLPFAPAALWIIGRYLQMRWSRPLLYGVSATLCIAVLACRLAAPPCGWWEVLRNFRVVFEPEEWQALSYLREHTPPEAVIMTDHYLNKYIFVISGVTGRAAYIEAAGLPVDAQAARSDQEGDRGATVRLLWSCSDEDTFRTILLRTPVDYLLEFGEHPLLVHPQSCLNLLWEGATGGTRIWSVTRQPVNEHIVDLGG